MRKVILQTDERIKNLFLEEIDLNVPSEETDLIKEGYLDSLKFVQMLSLLEEEFDIEISSEELEFDHFKTLNDISAFVEKKL